jgi:hypothetical protein
MTWAVSQASTIRRLVVEGDLRLFQAGYSSGGFMADSKVSGSIIPGSQQQFFSRNTDMKKWSGGNWNIVLVGNKNAPPSHCGQKGGHPITTIKNTPIIVEKPYIISSDSSYSLMVPKLEKNKLGPTENWENADEIPFS